MDIVVGIIPLLRTLFSRSDYRSRSIASVQQNQALSSTQLQHSATMISIRHPVFSTQYPATDNQIEVSSFQHPTSNTQPLTPSLQQPASSNQPLATSL